MIPTTEFSEHHLIKNLLQAISDSSVQVNTVDLINLYIFLKMKPLAIMTGGRGGGKRIVAEIVARALAGEDPFRLQVIDGHPGWIINTGRVALYAEAQSRMMRAKIQYLIEEARRQPTNSEHLFIICLKGISPAELYSVFTKLARQHQHKNSTIQQASFLAPLASMPDNLLIIGTMDTNKVDWLQSPDYPQIGHIIWNECEILPSREVKKPLNRLPIGNLFLKSRIVDLTVAQNRLDYILGDWRIALRLLQPLKHILENHQISIPQFVDYDFILYLANAWSTEHLGLFDSSHIENLTIATDLAIEQAVLPKFSYKIAESDELYKQLLEIVRHHPRSTDLLNHLQSRVVSDYRSSPDSNIIDPVCGMALKPNHDILQFQYRGTDYYFCSYNCKNAFAATPEKFIHESNVE